MNIFWFDLKLSSFFKMKQNLQGICKFLQILIYSTMIRKKHWFIGGTLTIFHNKLQQISFKKSLYEELILGKKDM
jgi:hypothetical protein